MRIEISASGFRVTPELRAYVLRRLHFKLGRFSERIDLARVRIVDVNGPRGGVDLHCRIQVLGTGVDGWASALAANLASAIDQAADRIHRVVGRELARASEPHRRRRTPSLETTLKPRG